MNFLQDVPHRIDREERLGLCKESRCSECPRLAQAHTSAPDNLISPLCVLIAVMKWNEDNKYELTFYEHSPPKLNLDHVYRIRFMRISSELFPFASHAKYGYSLDCAAADLKVRVPH